MRRSRREKISRPRPAGPLDRNAKCRIAIHVRPWSHRNRQPANNTRVR
jgi:hypothetical protein